MEKIKLGEAYNSTKIEKQTGFEYYQGLIWKRPSDEEVARLSKIFVETLANTSIMGPSWLPKEKFKKLVERSGTNRLLDLGSATTVFRKDTNQLAIEDAGVREYVGVDLGVRDTNFRARESDDNLLSYKNEVDPSWKEREPNQRIQLKSMHSEILAALHSFPDNYANVWMTGIESGNVISYHDEWGFALFAELKRVIPENGFIFTDGGFVDQVLEKCSLEFKEVRDALMKLYFLQVRRQWQPKLTDEEVASIPKLREQVEKYKSKEDDPFNLGKRLGKYVIDAPQIGFRIYFGEPDIGSWAEPIVIINTSKTGATSKNLE